MGNENFIELCKEQVVEYFNRRADKTDNTRIEKEDVFVVWVCKALQGTFKHDRIRRDVL